MSVSQLTALMTLIEEVQTEKRSRRESEHLNVAAFLGASGAVAWGVATLATVKDVTFYVHPALMATILIFFMALLVCAKIRREHGKHDELREMGKKLGDAVITFGKGSTPAWEITDWPHYLIGTHTKTHWLFSMTGSAYSAWLVIVTAFGAAGFCLSVWTLEVQTASSDAHTRGISEPISIPSTGATSPKLNAEPATVKSYVKEP